MQNHHPGVSTGASYVAHWAFRVNLILPLSLTHYWGPIHMGSYVTPWVLQGFNAMRKKIQILPFLRAMIRCIRQTEFVVNTCVTAPISIIDTFVSYVAIEKISNLFSQGIISNISCNASRGNVDFSPYRNKSLKAGIESCYSPPSYST